MKKLFSYRILTFLALSAIVGCSTFNYKTYDEEKNKDVDDPEPNYDLTLDPSFQEFTGFMFIGNRIENFSTYFNTYFNASENFSDAYDDYATKVLTNYSEKQDSIYAKPKLSQESIDKFNLAIEKASKVIQYHKSSEFMDRAVLLVGKSYYYLGDYLKAERKFGEFISRLKSSTYLDEALMYLAKTQLRLENEGPAIERLNSLIKTSKDKEVVSESYQAIAEYYLNKKDYANAITNFRKAIELSGDSEYKAQMQFLVASVIAKSDPLMAAKEFDRVLDYNASYDLEYLARLNNTKYFISSGKFPQALPLVEDLEVKYKDNTEYLAQVNYIKGVYYEEKKDFKNALRQYFTIMKKYPSTVQSSDASFRVAKYYETVKDDYLNAFRYYRYSIEQSNAGTNYAVASSKNTVYKKYFELRSIITGSEINTDYDLEFRNNTTEQLDGEGTDPMKQDGEGKPGGMSSLMPEDSLIAEDTSYTSPGIDSVKLKQEQVSNAKYELAEIFLYNLNRPDSGEYYLNDALKGSDDYEFRAKVLFALAELSRIQNNAGRSEEYLNQIIKEYPLSAVANSSRRLLNLSLTEDNSGDPADSLFNAAQEQLVNRQYEISLASFRRLLENYTGSVHTDKALYGAGWIYENILMNPDSAYFYYFSLVKSIPNSEAAAMVMEKVSVYESFNSTLRDTSGIKTDTTGTNEGKMIDPEQLLKESNETGKEDPSGDPLPPGKELPNKDMLNGEENNKGEIEKREGEQNHLIEPLEDKNK
jgi:TolA-binding protein